MGKLLTGLLIAGAAVAAGVVVTKLLKKNEVEEDFDELYDFDEEDLDIEIDEKIKTDGICRPSDT